MSDNIVMKTCIKCGLELPLTEQFFGRRPDSPDGYRNDCKDCVKKRRDGRHKENREDQLCKMKEYWTENIEAMRVYKKEYNQINRDMMVVKCHGYYQENRDKVLVQMKEHRIEHREEISDRRKKRYQERYDEMAAQRTDYYNRNRGRINLQRTKYQSTKRKNDIRYRIYCNLRSRINLALKSSSKSNGTINLLGCSIPELKKHLESQFLPGMTWETYGLRGWHVDHVVPCAVFDFTDPEQQKMCFNYTNLRPLWWLDNLKKGAKLERPFQFPLSLVA